MTLASRHIVVLIPPIPIPPQVTAKAHHTIFQIMPWCLCVTKDNLITPRQATLVARDTGGGRDFFIPVVQRLSSCTHKECNIGDDTGSLVTVGSLYPQPRCSGSLVFSPLTLRVVNLREGTCRKRCGPSGKEWDGRSLLKQFLSHLSFRQIINRQSCHGMALHLESPES